MTTFGILQPDGTLTNIREINESDIGKCPFVILDASHYREDGSCLCNDRKYRDTVMRKLGYKRSDFKRAGIL